MNGLFLLLLIIVVLFMFRKSGMGCCGGHGNHDASDPGNKHIDHPA